MCGRESVVKDDYQVFAHPYHLGRSKGVVRERLKIKTKVLDHRYKLVIISTRYLDMPRFALFQTLAKQNTIQSWDANFVTVFFFFFFFL